MTDDLDGGMADRTVELGWEGVNYTIDLSEANPTASRRSGLVTSVGPSSVPDPVQPPEAGAATQS
ncbi:Lsr2 dimerization domain-containing protein [Actinoplanes xinjiangensis]|uniref:Lsr2 dimerization domain-containing protein n=1 Tax=Actinoplanes xinjiangensis TaxID=512350 RepID=UPI003F4E15B5